MNIYVPHFWLADHLETDVSPEDLQKHLSLRGPSIERIEDKFGDRVYEIEITTNRMDTASVRGVAREASVILPQAHIPAKLKSLKMFKPGTRQITHDPQDFPLNIQVDHKLCPRVTCVILRVKKGQSPTWLSTRLEQVGIRSLDNIIDITNYVMTEIGQPTHAFDADRVGKTLVIRPSKKGEMLVTLDGKRHTLPGGDIVIDNGKGEITDLIGIMGTANSVVQQDTTRILFFIEHADPARIRKTSMGLAIRTNAAQLNEKMLDPNLVMDALLRGIALFQEVADAELESPILDLYPQPVQEQVISFPLAKTHEYLGIDISSKVQKNILEGLGCQITHKKDVFSITVPTFRPDLEIPVDIVEEIARIYGYHNLPSTLMDTRLPTAYPEDTNFTLEHDMKQFLAALGWQEVYTYSAVSKNLAEQSGKSAEKHIKLQNQLNDDHVYLRQSLVPSHEEIIANNRHLQDLSLFELANVYIPREKDLPLEDLRLTLTSTLPYRVVKGHGEALLAHLFIPTSLTEWKQTDDRHAEILVDGKQIGSIIHGNGHTVVGFVWKALLRVAQTHPTYTPISPYSPIVEDLTFTIPDGARVGDIVRELQHLHIIIQSVDVKDMYKKNVTFSIKYLRTDQQIATGDVEPVRKQIVQYMIDKKAKLIGEI
ncbi:MAG: phenylalanine--tRNA ligase subunit beta [Candidatus Pacebacteria bacterium]|nr:phenylalanine--tRNA ligase subunit beta [Candidatus Paceibacterota bacterium]